MPEDELVIRLRTDNQAEASLRSTADSLRGVGDAAKSAQTNTAKFADSADRAANATTEFARATGTSFANARQFAASLGLSAEKAAQAAQRIQSLNSVNATTADKFRVLGRTLGITRQQFEQLDDAIARTSQSSGRLNGFFTGLAQGAGQQAFGVITNALSQIPGSVLNTVTQFEKFDAVLTNLLGSAEAADAALAGIQQFAATTPFQLDQVVSAFIKLQQRGIEPTNEVLTQLGDIALSQGKDLDQIVEAILDAQTGQFERLKEFGIIARTEGDRVALTFRGVQQVVEKTPEAISAAILGFGQLEGVQGNIAGQSERLGGQLSNLQDNVAQIALAFGQELLPELLEIVKELNSGGEGAQEFARSLGSGVGDVVGLLANAFKLAADNAGILSVILQTLLLRMIAIRAVALFNTFIATAAGITAAQAASLSFSTQLAVLRGAMVSSAASATALVAALAPLLVVAGAIAGIQFAKFANDLADANTAISGAAAGTEANASGAIAAANRTKAALDELNKAREAGQQLTQQEIEDNRRLVAANDFRLQQLQKDLEAAEALPAADEAQRQAKENLTQSIQTSINALQGQNNALKEAIGLGGQAASSTRDQTEALKEQADLLKQTRDEQFTGREQQREDANIEAQRAFEDEKQARQAAFEEQSRQAQAAFEESQRQAQGSFEAAERASQAAFEEQQKAREASFNESQRAAEAAFQKDLEQRKQAAQDRLDAGRQAVDDQLALANARGEERVQLIREQAQRRQQEQLRLQLERQQFGGLTADEAQAQLNEQFQAEEAKFNEQQQAEEAKFNEEQQAREQAYAEEQRQLQALFEQQQQQQQAAFEEQQRAAQAAFKAEEEARDRAFEDQKRAEDRRFAEEKRAFDLETARQVKAILESAQIQAPTPTTGQTPTSRFTGGAMRAGQPYLVGDRPGGQWTPYTEVVVPDTSSYVIAASRARQWLAQMNPRVNVAPVVEGDRRLLNEVRALRKELSKVQPVTNVKQTNNFAAAPVEDKSYWRRQYKVARIQRGAID